MSELNTIPARAAAAAEAAAPRANRKGSPCPPWCETDHGKEISPGIWNDTHFSAPVRPLPGPFTPCVYLLADGPDSPRVGVAGGVGAFVNAGRPWQARQLAGLLEQLADLEPGGMRLLADAVRAAAAIAGEAA